MKIFTIICCNCWKQQDEMDSYLYNELKMPIKKLTWDNPLPKDHKDIRPIINNTYDINYNTSNLIPTYNTTNNTSNLTQTYNTTNNITKITKIIDPDNIINPLSSCYNRIL